jgi:uncharacterized protein (TIGR03083 family)
VSTPAYPELVAAVRQEGEGILAAGGLGLEVAVPTCPGWDLAALVQHVSGIYAFAGHVVETRATVAPETRPPLPDGDALVVFESLLDNLVSVLSDASPDTPVWNWSSTAEPIAAFWARRLAHESSVHRFDAQIAHDMPQPIDAELAADGLDELIDVLSPRTYERNGAEGPRGSVLLESLDDGTWYVGLEPTGVQRLDVIAEPDATASALLLAAYGRVPWSALSVEGDLGVLDQWSAAMHF